MTDWLQRDQLHAAALEGDLTRVRDLVERGYPLDRFDELGKTPLHYAAAGEYFAVAEFLIRHGADVNARDESHCGNTPLAEIADACSRRMAELLVTSGADPTVPGWMQLTALDRALARKRREGTGSVGQAVHELLLKSTSSRKR